MSGTKNTPGEEYVIDESKGWGRTDTPLLEFRDINTHYGAVHILKDVNLAIYPGELVCLLGGNASGKSTTLKTLLGMVTPTTGQVVLDGEVVNDKPTSYRVERGVTMVPENRRLFKRLSVKENLELGAYLRNDRAGINEDLERIYTMFPRVKERLNQKSGTLSGGEQQMVAMGRALMSRPRVLLMDEPSMGLAPALVQTNFELIQQIHSEGVAIFMVEQNANMALSIADRGWVLQTGKVVLDDTAEALMQNEALRSAYLGH
jgi:branched-chain amino acid transport system ATP-binding protein